MFSPAGPYLAGVCCGCCRIIHAAVSVLLRSEGKPKQLIVDLRAGVMSCFLILPIVQRRASTCIWRSKGWRSGLLNFWIAHNETTARSPISSLRVRRQTVSNCAAFPALPAYWVNRGKLRYSAQGFRPIIKACLQYGLRPVIWKRICLNHRWNRCSPEKSARNFTHEGISG